MAQTPSVLDSVLGMLKTHLKFDQHLLHRASSHHNCFDFFDINVRINTALITKHPELFRAENHIFSRMPTNMCYDGGKDRYCIGVGTRSLQCQYSLELAQDLKSINGFDAEEALMEIIVEEIAAEIRYMQFRLAETFRQYKMLSYIPVQIVVINPDNFQPYIGFKTRYAAVPRNWKILTAAEEREITMQQQRKYLA